MRTVQTTKSQANGLFFSSDLLSIPKRNSTMNVKFLSPSKEFRFLNNVNRPVKQAHVLTMTHSVAKIGIIRPVVVAKYKFRNIEDYYILDGQNLYCALKKLNLEIPYVETKVSSDEELIDQIALMNTSSKSWKMKDYLQAWSYIRKDYAKLMAYGQKSTLEIVFIAAIFLGYKGWSGSIVKRLRIGDFQINNEARGKQIISYMEDVLAIMPTLSRFIHKRFLSAYLGFVTDTFSSYNHKKFLAYMRKNSDLIVKADFKPNLIDEFFAKY